MSSYHYFALSCPILSYAVLIGVRFDRIENILAKYVYSSNAFLCLCLVMHIDTERDTERGGSESVINEVRSRQGNAEGGRDVGVVSFFI
jgi:hypothetical protein